MSSSECTARPRENPQTVGLLLGGPRGGGWHRVVFLIKLTSRFRGSMATIPTVGALDGHLEGCQRHLFPLKPTRKSNTTSHGSDLRGDTAATRGDTRRQRKVPKMAERPIVFISARVHPGETPGQWLRIAKEPIAFCSILCYCFWTLSKKNKKL